MTICTCNADGRYGDTPGHYAGTLATLRASCAEHGGRLPKTCLSFGAGVQTTALLVLIAQGRWPRPDAIVFADTGNEHQETYTYLAEVSGPYARANGLEITVLGSDWRTGHYAADLETYCRQWRIVPGTWVRWCTDRYKVRPIIRYVRRVMKATKAEPIEGWIGISTDENRRAVMSSMDFQTRRYPLIELGLSRDDCAAIIRDAGLPAPPKSGCWFCPFQKQARWHQLKRESPDLFDRALYLEENAKTKSGTKVYLPIFGSLQRVAQQEELPGFDATIEAEGGCVSGSCHV